MLHNIFTPAGSGRACALGLTAVLAAGAPHAARAQTATITSTIAAQNFGDPLTYPANETIGTFGFNVPAYYTLIGATVSGDWGNSFLTPNTAAGTYSVGGVTVFTCNDGDACWGSETETPWSFTFTAQELDSLVASTSNHSQAEDVLFSVIQSEAGNVNTDTTTLTLLFAVPEPGSLALFGAGVLGLGLITRRKRS
jgi:hypothetical protein